MPSLIDSAEKMDAIVNRVNSVEDISRVVERLDPSSKDIPLFLQVLEIEGKGDLVKEYNASFIEEDE